MNTSLDFSESFQAAMASDAILTYLYSGGDWFSADQMHWQQELNRVRSEIKSNPTPALLRREAEALVGLCQMTSEELAAAFPQTIVAAFSPSVSSVPPVAPSRSAEPRKSVSWAPRATTETRAWRSSPAPMTKSGLHRSAAVNTPQRPTKPVAPHAPVKPAVGIQSRFAALMESDSE